MKRNCLPLRKSCLVEHENYLNFILPNTPEKVSFKETVSILLIYFLVKRIHFYTSWQCMNLAKDKDGNFITYTSNVNRMCEKFKLDQLSPDRFKCLSSLKVYHQKQWCGNMFTNPYKTWTEFKVNDTDCCERVPKISNLRHDAAKMACRT